MSNTKIILLAVCIGALALMEMMATSEEASKENEPIPILTEEEQADLIENCAGANGPGTSRNHETPGAMR